MDSIITLKKISKTYNMGKIPVSALIDINLNIAKNDFICIVGPSGSGKTTLLNIMGCIDTPTNGEYLFMNKPVNFKNKKQLVELRRKKFGFIFQTFNLIKVLNVYENISLPLEMLYRPKNEINEKVEKIIKLVGLDGFQKRLPSELSGGQQQRVAIARAIIKEPDIIFADEPTANLDHTTGKKIVELMKNLNKTLGITFIFSTHDPKIMEIADRIVILEDGKIIEIK